MEQSRAVARMKLLKLKEAMSASARTKSKRKEQLQRREVAAKNSANEPSCSKNVRKDFLSLPLRNIVSSREAHTASCVFSRSPPITTNTQPVTSKVDIVDKKTNLNVAAKNFVPKQQVFINRDETLSASHPYLSVQSLPVGPVPLGNVNTSMVQINSIALETIKGLSTKALPYQSATYLVLTATPCITMAS